MARNSRVQARTGSGRQQSLLTTGPVTASADDLSPTERIGPTPAHRVGRSRCPAPMAVLDQNERRVCSGIRIPSQPPPISRTTASPLTALHFAAAPAHFALR